MRVILAVLGMLIGAALGNASILIGVVLGGFIGFAIAELSLLRAMIVKLEKEVSRLNRKLKEDSNRESAAQVQPNTTPAAPRSTPLDTPAAPPAPQRPVALGTPSPAIVRAPDAATMVSAATPPAPPPSRPQLPREPDLPIVAAIKRFFTGGNTLVQAGVVVLFFGVAFLLRYLAEHSHVSIEVRLSGIAFGGVVLLVLGWRLRRRRTGYALALQGGGVGILYLTVFAAMRLYELLPPAMAFGFLVLIAALSAMLAVLQDSIAFALLGITGGFLAPVLAATGEGNHIVLFSYYAVLNCGIAAIAWFKAWRPLNVAGFLFTFAIATAWGVLKYEPQYFASTEPFLIFFFLLYVAIAMLFTLRQPAASRGLVDGALVFGNPIAAFGLQSAMLRHDSMALAYSALGLSGLYMLLTAVVKERRDASQQLLFESFLGLAVAFLTLAIPLALGSRMNSAAWALEGAALVWIGCRQNRRAARGMGTLLMVCAALLLVQEFGLAPGPWFISLSALPGVILVSVACMASVWNLDHTEAWLENYEELYPNVLFFVGLLAWVSGGLGVLPHLVTTERWPAAAIGFLALTSWISSELAVRWEMKRAATTSLLLLPVMYVFLCAALGRHLHPFVSGGWAGWTAAFVILYLVLYRHERAPQPDASNVLHAFSAWLLCLVLGWEAGWAVGYLTAPASPEWAQAARVLPAALPLLAMPRLMSGLHWPFTVHRKTYLGVAGLGICVGLIGWSLASDFLFEGNAAPLPYFPLFNPLDVAQALALLAFWRYASMLRRESMETKGVSPWEPPAVLAALLFLWLNAMLIRSLHHWIGVPLKIEALAASNVVQTSLSIFWSVLALVTMLLASRKGSRAAWLVGAGLLTVVIVKLFFVDLASVGSIERIVSFVGVGVAMLVVGYFSPLPPRLKES